jgi:catechol 2,3-dioxygenase-like lactoylglutathione lyase family enzyme
MLDHVSITVSDIPSAERFYDAIMKALDVVKVGRREDWLGYGERARPAHPDRSPGGNRVEAVCHLAP